MIGSTFKVIAALIIGYIVGFLCGFALGVLLGLAPSLFFREIVSSNQTILMSLLLAVILGGLLGSLEVQVFNKIFATSDNPLIGTLAGAILGLVLVVFVYGVLDVPSSGPFNQRFYSVPMLYSSTLGSRIGAIIFSVFGAAETVREIAKPYQEVRSIN